MRKLAIWFVILVLLPVLVLGGAYGFYWYQVKSFVDDLAHQLKDDAQLQYASIYVDPRGEVGVDGVSVTLNADGTRIPVESIRIRSDDPFFFLDPRGRIEDGNWPSRLNLVVQQAQLSLNSSLVKTLERQAAGAVEDPLAFSPDALACGDLRQLGVAELREMGYSQLNADMVLGLDVDRINRRIGMNADFTAAGMGSSAVNLSFSVASDDLAPMQVMAANPRLRSMEVNYHDEGYNIRRDRFCAEQAGVDVDAYKAEHRRLMERWLLSHGVDLPELLWDVYSGVNAPRGSFSLVMRPPGGLGPEVMMGVGAPADLIERLNLDLRLNGQRVAVNSINWSSIQVDPVPFEVLGETLASGSESGPAVDEAVDVLEAIAEQPDAADKPAEVVDANDGSDRDALFRGMPKREPKPEPKRYRETSLAQLAGLTGQQVRVRTELGNKFEGRIVEVSGGDTLLIEQRVDKGLITYPLEFDQISSAEVYR